MGSIISKLDADQVIRKSYDDDSGALKVLGVGGNLVPDKYDHIVLTYVPAKDLIQTVTYSLGGSDICTLTLTYDGTDRLTEVERTDV